MALNFVLKKPFAAVISPVPVSAARSENAPSQEDQNDA